MEKGYGGRSMKFLADIAKSVSNIDQENKLVHLFFSSEGYIAIDPPKWSCDLECPFCGGKEFFLYMVDKERRAWGCKRICLGSKLNFGLSSISTPPTSKRAIVWPLFCELNGIGDVHYDVRFENIQQNQKRIDFMLNFSTSPKGILVLRGDTGCGKTYAAMGMCEMFTRKNEFCVFTTQKTIEYTWNIHKNDPMNKYLNSLNKTFLLVIDDFGIGEPDKKFLEFVMELINNRIQWTNRGTIITTNLKADKLNLFCGEALSDRLLTGKIINFEGNSRREKTIL